MKYTVVRHKFTKSGANEFLTLPKGQSIVQVIDKHYEGDGIILVLLIGESDVSRRM